MEYLGKRLLSAHVPVNIEILNRNWTVETANGLEPL